MQNFIAFKSHGGVTEEFALNAGVDNEKQIFYATAWDLGASVQFRVHMIRVNESTADEVRMIRERIAHTIATIAGLPDSHQTQK